MHSTDDFNTHILKTENVLVLKNATMFENTTMVRGSCEIPSVNPEENGCFSGYVFRGDYRSPETVFREGFEKQVVLTQEDIGTVTGDMDGLTHNRGISSTVCATVASRYGLGRTNVPGSSGRHRRGNVYLIDAVTLRGFAIPTPRPNHRLVEAFPILQRIYEVNFTHNIPSDHVIGLVWPYEERPFDNALLPWFRPDKLCLAVNPQYRHGIDGAREVVARFNEGVADESGCSIQ